jgi:hypothetical protein
MLSFLIDANADVNATNIHGVSGVASACQEDRLACLQLLVDVKSDLGVKNKDGDGTMFTAMLIPNNESAHRVPGMPFAVQCCNADGKSVPPDGRFLPQAKVDRHLKEYTLIHNFIDECHTVTKHALSDDVVVDTRVGRGDNGVYHEPLEQVLLYLGLSMKKNQTVNKSIDGKSVKRALMPGHPTNANLWFELYQRTHCFNCSTLVAKPKKCPCHTACYCNIDCQRKHWNTHKPSHKAAMLKKKKTK